MLKRIFLKIWIYLRVYWSNLANKLKGNIEYEYSNLESEDIIDNVDNYSVAIKNRAKDLYSNFEYKLDGPGDLFDRMRRPGVCYYDYKVGKLLDDCDGFAAALYHITSYTMPSAILTYMVPNLNECHSTLVVKLPDNKYAYVNYTSVRLYNSIEEIVNYISKNHPDLICYNLVKYNYSKYKYEIIKEI